jgi:hypothetical protein
MPQLFKPAQSHGSAMPSKTKSFAGIPSALQDSERIGSTTGCARERQCLTNLLVYYFCILARYFHLILRMSLWPGSAGGKCEGGLNRFLL